MHYIYKEHEGEAMVRGEIYDSEKGIFIKFSLDLVSVSVFKNMTERGVQVFCVM